MRKGLKKVIRKRKTARGLTTMIKKPSALCSVMSGRKNYTMTQEFPIFAISGPFTGPGTINGSFGLGIYSGGTNSIPVFAAPQVQANLFSIAQSASVNPSSYGIGWGYSGKYREALLAYQYMRVKGFKLTFENTTPTGSEAVNNTILTISNLPDFSLAILPSDLNGGYTGIVTNLLIDTIVPSDLYEYDASLRVQPNNTSPYGVSKYFAVPSTIIVPRAVGAATNFSVLQNAWIDTKSASSLEWCLFIGWENMPTLQSTGTISVVAPSIRFGSVRVETFLEFAIPIKNQVIV